MVRRRLAVGVLDLGVAAMVGLEIQGVVLAVGDEGVIAVAGEPGQLGTWRGFRSMRDDAQRHGVGLMLRCYDYENRQ